MLLCVKTFYGHTLSSRSWQYIEAYGGWLWLTVAKDYLSILLLLLECCCQRRNKRNMYYRSARQCHRLCWIAPLNLLRHWDANIESFICRINGLFMFGSARLQMNDLIACNFVEMVGRCDLDLLPLFHVFMKLLYCSSVMGWNLNKWWTLWHINYILVSNTPQ